MLLIKFKLDKFALLIFTWLIVLSCHQNKQVDYTYYDSGEVKEKMVFELQKSIIDSNYTSFRFEKNGDLISKSVYKNGLISNLTEYYNNGLVKRTQPYKNGERFGIENKYTLSHEITESNFYINGYQMIKMESFRNGTSNADFYYYTEPDTMIEMGRLLFDSNNKIIGNSSFYYTIEGKDTLRKGEDQTFNIAVYTYEIKSKISDSYFGDFNEDYEFKDSTKVIRLKSDDNKLVYTFAPDKIGYNLFMGKIYVTSDREANEPNKEMTREFIIYKDFYVKDLK